jgi:hypothetical protein
MRIGIIEMGTSAARWEAAGPKWGTKSYSAQFGKRSDRNTGAGTPGRRGGPKWTMS